MRLWKRKPSGKSEIPYFCPVCKQRIRAFGDGPGGRPNARCVRCHALERHRFLAILLAAFADEVAASRHVLEVAPTPSVTRLLRAHTKGSYVGVDIDPSADGRAVQVVADLCAAPFPDGIFETAVCFHVFEHIPDDLTAMSEYARILAAEGVGFVQNPWRAAGPTDEDPTASAQERVKRFGQADHVRVYGADFEERLGSVGLRPFRIIPDNVVPKYAIDLMGLKRRFPIWLVVRADSARWRGELQAVESEVGERLKASLPQND